MKFVLLAAVAGTAVGTHDDSVTWNHDVAIYKAEPRIYQEHGDKSCGELKRTECCKFMDGREDHRYGEFCVPAHTETFSNGNECAMECWVRGDCPWMSRGQKQQGDESALATTCPDRLDATGVSVMHAEVTFRYLHDGHCASGWLGAERSTIQPSLFDCFRHCMNMKACKYFAYEHELQVCAAYGPHQRCPADTRYQDFKSFEIVRATDPVPDTSYHLLHPGHCALGWIEGQNMQRDTLHDCAEWCRGFPICRYFSHHETELTCSLYSAYGLCPSDGQAKYAEYNSYILYKPGEHFEQPLIQPYWYQHDRLCAKGKILPELLNMEVDECVQRCYKVVGCSYFSWGKAGKTCILYTDEACPEGAYVKGFASWRIIPAYTLV